MMKEWETFNDPSKNELAIPGRVVYDDFQGKPVETNFDIVLNPVEEIGRKFGHADYSDPKYILWFTGTS